MANLSSGLSNSSYYDLASRRQVFSAYAAVTAPVIYSTAAGTGGPLLWNGSAQGGANQVNAVILGVSCALSVVSTVAAALGITGNNGQTVAPSTTTAITTSGNLWVGGAASKCTTYNVGTPTNAGNFFVPLIQLGTGALTVDDVQNAFIDLGGCIVVPPNAWISIAASATATTTVAALGLIWAEVPIL
jgi:hypothetical protein